MGAALESARQLDHPALIVDAAVALARHAPDTAEEMKQVALAALVRIEAVVPPDWKDEFAASPRVAAVAAIAM